MTILFFSRLFYPHIGGVEKHVLEVSKLLIKKGHTVTVLTEKFERGLLNTDEIDGIKILRIDNGRNNWFKKFRVWKNLWKYRKLIRKSDIVHVHDVFFWYLPFRFLYPSKKVFTTFHGYEENGLPTKKTIFMHKLAEKFSYGNICVGDFLKKWYGTKPTYVIYGAVDSKLLKYDQKLLRPTKDIVFVGRLEEETGIMEYLKVLLILKKKKITLKMDVFGNGSLEDGAKEYVKYNNLKVNFKGFVPNVTDYIRDYKYIFTSGYLGILEGMALKKPIFAEFNSRIKKDYLEMAPFAKFISISADYKQLSLSIEYFLKDKQKRENMINNGYNWVKDKTWDNLVNMYLSLWNKS